MNKAFLLIGGNLGDRFGFLSKAKDAIVASIGSIVKRSSVYETAPWGFQSEQNFLNEVILISTTLSPRMLLEHCLKIEKDLGRVRFSNQYSSRTMDIDILFYNEELIEESDLIIPHEKLHQRRFTLEPMAELEPEFIHPKFKKTIKELLQICEDDSAVKKL